MPRKRRKTPFQLPPRQTFTASTDPLFDADLSHSAYRLQQMIVALSWKDGFIDCYLSEIAAYLSASKETVRRLLGTLVERDLVDATTLADGRQRLTPADSGDLPSGLPSRRLFEPVDATHQNSEGEKPSSRTPHTNGSLPAATKMRRYPSQKCDDTPLHEEEDLNTNLNKQSSSSSREVSSQKCDDTPVSSQKCDDTTVFDLWERYFELDQRVVDVLRSYLADDQVRQVAREMGLSPPEWLEDAIKLTADYGPNRPLRYFQRVVDDALLKGIEQTRLETLPPPALPEPEPPDALAGLWRDVTAALRRQMTQATFDASLAGTRLVSSDNGLYTIEVAPNAVDWLENRLKTTILRALEAEVGEPVKISFTAKGEFNAT